MSRWCSSLFIWLLGVIVNQVVDVTFGAMNRGASISKGASWQMKKELPTLGQTAVQRLDQRSSNLYWESFKALSSSSARSMRTHPIRNF